MLTANKNVSADENVHM